MTTSFQCPLQRDVMLFRRWQYITSTNRELNVCKHEQCSLYWHVERLFLLCTSQGAFFIIIHSLLFSLSLFHLLEVKVNYLIVQITLWPKWVHIVFSNYQRNWFIRQNTVVKKKSQVSTNANKLYFSHSHINGVWPSSNIKYFGTTPQPWTEFHLTHPRQLLIIMLIINFIDWYCVFTDVMITLVVSFKGQRGLS